MAIKTYGLRKKRQCSDESKKTSPLAELDANDVNERSRRVNKKSKLAVSQTKLSVSQAVPPAKPQIQLVLGNQSQTTCKQCLMSYVPSSSLDTMLHDKFHKTALEGRAWASVSGENKVLTNSTNEYIVRVDSSSCLAHKRVAEDLLSLVNTELSAPPENPTWKDRSGQGAAFVYVKQKRAVAIAVVERISKGRLMNVSSGQLSAETYPTVMGISRIYCTRKYRRLHLATTLLDTCRKEFIYGLDVGKHQVGWSQPSASGIKLASSWCGRTIDGDLHIMTYLE